MQPYVDVEYRYLFGNACTCTVPHAAIFFYQSSADYDVHTGAITTGAMEAQRIVIISSFATTFDVAPRLAG